MKIKMLVGMVGNGFAVSPGDVVDREDAEAIRLVEREYAVPALPSRERAVQPPPREVRGKSRGR